MNELDDFIRPAANCRKLSDVRTLFPQRITNHAEKMVPDAGFEPATFGLQNRPSGAGNGLQMC
jgi:hypothetical protein